MLKSRYFAAKQFSNKFLGGIPQEEIIVVPVPKPTTGSRGGGYIMYNGWAHLFQNMPTRKRKDAELVAILTMFAALEEEENGRII